MTTATATRKPKTKTAKQPSTETDDELLARTFQFDDGAFAKLKENGADDDQVLVAIRQRWRMAAVAGKRPYHVSTNDARWGTCIWFDTFKPGDEEPSLHYRVSKNGGVREGYLVQVVRRIFEIPGVNGAAIKEKPVPAKAVRAVRAEIKRDKAAATSNDLLAGIEVLGEGEFPFSFFKRTTLNPRTSFDEEMIASMAPTIKGICQLNPILCLADGTIVDGETRHRAGEVAGVKTLCGKKINCTPEQAAVIRLQTTIQRRDLNPMDRAVAMQKLQLEHGKTVDEIAIIVGMQKGDSVRNIIRLLELPDEWQESVRSGELRASAARELVPWKDIPTVLACLREKLNEEPIEVRSVALSDCLESAIRKCGRLLKDPYYWTGNRNIKLDLKPTEEQAAELCIRTVKLQNRGEQQFAFNLDLWKELVDAAVKADNAREAKRIEKELAGKKNKATNGTVDPAKALENLEQQRKIFAKKVYRFRTAWYQAMCIASVAVAEPAELIGLLLFVCATGHGAGRRQDILDEDLSLKTIYGDRKKLLNGLVKMSYEDVRELMEDLLKRQVAEDFSGFHNVFNPVEIEALATHFDIDLKRDWTSSFDEGEPCEHLWDSFVGLWTKDQMIELLAEWKIKPTLILEQATRKEIAALLTSAKPCPKAIVDAKAVPLC